ncbi:alpha/beta fold hydrolase [Mycobacterium sp. NAZ190054]|uniref:alpha/beta fold hydrolase n=1 Tax=Mycobacterium sp. NAZ190054 TaxID=1747766 RepID=UPI0007985378|nr:alpha/beta fold hydrolase [Mycobacterium sp. NAZ190054]KWX66439.1 alpha/beta hydrolase [Mycobacterium sp. NAZ190054]
MAEYRFAVNGEVKIRFLDSGGDDRGAPVVFVPGFTCVADDYLESLPLLGRRCVVVELRGHGQSDCPPAGYDSATLGGDVGAVVDEITDGPVHLMTFSRGTPYALTWALANPGRVRSISLGDYVPEEIVLTEDVMLGLLDGRWRGAPVHERVDHDAALAVVRSARAQSFWERLSAWQPPLLVVRAVHSPLIDDAAWSRYRDLFPTAALHEFADSPHDIFRPDRGRYPTLVRDHIDSVDPALSGQPR